MEFKKVEGFEKYLIGEDGTVIGARGNPLKADPNSTGYLRVTLSRDGEIVRRFVHQLVAEHFCKRGSECQVVHHKDGDILNNHKDNLEYCSMSYNVLDGWKRGRFNPNKYSPETLQTLKGFYLEGVSASETSRQLGLDRSTVTKYFKEFRERATTIREE